MENEVIINGCDVAECEHLKNDGIKKPICRSGGCARVYKNCLCEGNKNCHFKQLQRAKSENEKLKSKIPWFEKWCLSNNERIKYKQALEEIKKILNGKYDLHNLEKIRNKINEVLNNVGN